MDDVESFFCKCSVFYHTADRALTKYMKTFCIVVLWNSVRIVISGQCIGFHANLIKIESLRFRNCSIPSQVRTKMHVSSSSMISFWLICQIKELYHNIVKNISQYNRCYYMPDTRFPSIFLQNISSCNFCVIFA